MAHTPGPWALKEGSVEHGDMSEIIATDKTEAGDPWRIAYVLCETRNKHQRSEDLDNARLIAAAPDLLAVLERYASGYYTDAAIGVVATFDDDVSAAIAKARGS